MNRLSFRGDRSWLTSVAALLLTVPPLPTAVRAAQPWGAPGAPNAFGARHPQNVQNVEGPDDLADLAAFETSLQRGQLGRDTAEPLDEYLADFPDSVRALTLRATLRRRKGRYEEAQHDLDLARKGAAAGGALLLSWAAAAFDLACERGQYDACGELLDFAVANSPSDDRALTPIASRRVLLLTETGRRAEASKFFATALKDLLPKERGAPAAEPAFLLEYARALVALRHCEAAAELLAPLEKRLRDASDPRQGEALLLLGRTYRIGHSGGDDIPALDALQVAMRIDKSSVEALVERARAKLFRYESDDADAAINDALAINERSPDAWSVRGEILLLDQRASEGLDAAEHALRECPPHSGALAVKAAALWILGRKPESQKVLAELLTHRPEDAEPVCRFADALNYLYRFREAIPIYQRAIQLDPTWSYSYVGLARCLVNTGDLAQALAMMTEFRRRDRVPYMLADNVADALKKLAGFVEVRRGTFTYVMHPIESPVLVPLLDEIYARVWPDLCKRYGFEPDHEVRVECFPHHDDFSARTVGFTGFGALGVCFGDVFTLLSPRSELRGQFAFDKTAVHELAHVVTLGLSRNKVPRWLTEGISVHEEHVYQPSGDREMDLELFNYFHSREIVPVRELNRIFGGPKILFGYYEGGLLCDFLVDQRGDGVLTEMLRRFGRDEETPAVVQAVLGMSCEELDQQFLAWIERTKLAAMKVQPTYTENGRRRLIERVYASEHPDAALLAQVAWAYHAARRPIDRDDFLNQALAKDPRLPAAHFLMAERALQARRIEEALSELETGIQAGGEEFFALLRYTQLLGSKQGIVESGTRPNGHPRPGAKPAGGAAPPEGAGDAAGDEAASGALDLTDAERGARERLLELLARTKSCFPRFVGENNPYVLRARLLRELGRDNEALDELRAFCAIDESDVQAREVLSQRALEHEEWNDARRWLRELRLIDPFRRAIWRDLAHCERKLQSPAAAIALVEGALQIDPSTEPDYDPARAANPDDTHEAHIRAELLLDLVELELEVGETAAADRALEEARRLAPDLERLAEFKGRG